MTGRRWGGVARVILGYILFLDSVVKIWLAQGRFMSQRHDDHGQRSGRTSKVWSGGPVDDRQRTCQERPRWPTEMGLPRIRGEEGGVLLYVT